MNRLKMNKTKMNMTEKDTYKMNRKNISRAQVFFAFMILCECLVLPRANIIAAEITQSELSPIPFESSVSESVPISPASIAWSFYTYAAPDFTAERLGFFPPQSVAVLNEQEDGWALIDTYLGQAWVYLPENKIYTQRPLPLYDNKEDDTATSELSPQTVTVVEQDGSWLKIKTWLGEKWIDLNAVRESVLLDVPSYNQRALGYPTGCEIVSLGMMINYAASVDVKDLVAKMPRANDPNEGFRGEPTSKDGFSIFPPALLALAAEYVTAPVDLSGGDIDDLKEKLNAERPVVVWVNGLGFNVHAVCLSGYNGDGFFYNDPWTGRKDSFIIYDSFYRIWDKPINDRLTGDSFPTRKALSYE